MAVALTIASALSARQAMASEVLNVEPLPDGHHVVMDANLILQYQMLGQRAGVDARRLFEAYVQDGKTPPYDIRLAYVAQTVAAWNAEHGNRITYGPPSLNVRIDGHAYPVSPARIDDARIASDYPFVISADGLSIDPSSFWVENDRGIPILSEAALEAYLSAVNQLDCDGTVRLGIFLADYDRTAGREVYTANSVANFSPTLRRAGISDAVTLESDAVATLPVQELTIGSIVTFGPRGQSYGPREHVYIVTGFDGEGRVLITESTVETNPEFQPANGPTTRAIPVGDMSIYTTYDGAALSTWTTQVFVAGGPETMRNGFTRALLTERTTNPSAPGVGV